MRFYLSHRLPFGFRGTVGMGSFHHSRVLVAPPGSGQAAQPNHTGLFFLLLVAIVAGIYFAH